MLDISLRLRKRVRVGSAPPRSDHVLTVDSRMCLARGRPFLVPITRILKDCDEWHKSPLAEAQDGPLLSMAVLRRDLVSSPLRILTYKHMRMLTWCKDGLFATVRALCDGSQTVSSDGSLVAQS